MVDGLLRSITGAPQVAHGEPEGLRSHNVAGERGAMQGRYLRLALALLGHAEIQASRHPGTLQHEPAGEGRWWDVPSALWHRTQRGPPAGRRLLFEGLRDAGTLD